MNINELSFNPFTKIGREWALVTAGDETGSNTMTVSWGGVGVLWGKNVTYIFIRESRYTKEFIDKGETFSLAFFDEEYRKALQYCGSHTGRGIDKWAEAGLTPAYSDGCAYPAEAALVMICKKMAAVPVSEDSFLDPEILPKWYADRDMHTMYAGEIINILSK